MLYNVQCFIVLAHELNFTRAAEIMNITQSAFSKIISGLEHDVGCSLFSRNKRSVQLTAAGAAFLTHAENIMQEFSTGIDDAQQTKRGTKGSLKIAFLGTCMECVLPEILACFRTNYPAVNITIYDGTQRQAMEFLRSDRVDVALFADLSLDDLPDCSFQTIYSDRYCVVVNRDHPLANCEKVTLSMFKDDTFLSIGVNSVYSHLTISGINHLIKACAAEGFAPTIFHGANHFTNLPLMVECGMGVAFLAEHMKKYASPNIRFLRTEQDDLWFSGIAAWKNGNRNPCLQNFISTLQTYVTQGNTSGPTSQKF